jgi:hypothetical protein
MTQDCYVDRCGPERNWYAKASSTWLARNITKGKKAAPCALWQVRQWQRPARAAVVGRNETDGGRRYTRTAAFGAGSFQ